jgi:hypothetical protein
MSIEIGTLVVWGTAIALGLLAGGIGAAFGMPFGLGFLGGFSLLPVVMFTLWLLWSVVELFWRALDQFLFRNGRGRRRR